MVRTGTKLTYVKVNYNLVSKLMPGGSIVEVSYPINPATVATAKKMELDLLQIGGIASFMKMVVVPGDIMALMHARGKIPFNGSIIATVIV